jgi:ADP-ribose pyrophosphatase
MKRRPELKKIQLMNRGRFLKTYCLEYETRSGRRKEYELVSRTDLESPDQLGKVSSGVSVIVYCGQKLLLLKEFRMAINDYVFNLVGGMLESGESIEECVCREVFEETGLTVTEIKAVLPPAYAAVAISDITTNLVIAEAKGHLKEWDEKENIFPGLYTKEEVRELLKSEKFAARCQMIAYYFSME